MTKTRPFGEILQIVMVFMLLESLPGAIQGSSAIGKHTCVASRLRYRLCRYAHQPDASTLSPAVSHSL